MTLSDFFFNIPIYEKIEINTANYETFQKIIDSHNKEEFDGYNPWRKLESTFVVVTDLKPNGNTFEKNGGYGNIRIK